MKKSIIVILGLIVLIGIFAIWFMGIYNSLVQSDETVKSAWGNVENQYQRRSDLIPNLVASVKGYAAHEAATLENVINARAKATQMSIDPTNLTEESLAQFQSVQGELSSALNRLLVTVEAYPDLKANQNFLDLQAQLEGTENRIATERMRFNETARDYNSLVRRFPNNIIAGISGFSVKPYFKSETGAEKAPEVNF